MVASDRDLRGLCVVSRKTRRRDEHSVEKVDVWQTSQWPES